MEYSTEEQAVRNELIADIEAMLESMKGAEYEG